MSNVRNIALGGAAVTTFVVAFHKSMQHQLIDAYPLRDPKLVKKAFNQMMRDALSGKLIGKNVTNEFLDDLFDEKYNNLVQNA